MPTLERSRGRGFAGPLAGVFAATSVFVVLAISVSGKPGRTAEFDDVLHTWLITHRTAPLDVLARVVTFTATPVFATAWVFAIAVAVSTGAAIARLRRAIAPAALMSITLVARYVVSQLIARPRPPRTDWAWHATGQSFPSGHTTAAALAAGVVGWLTVRRVRERFQRCLVWTVSAGYVLVIAWTRTYLGVHWPTDVLAGAAFAVAVLSLVAAGTTARLTITSGSAR